MIDSVVLTPKSTVGEDFDLLEMTVVSLRDTYGELKLEYSEHGPGQPVYSMERLPGVLLVFYNWNMDKKLIDTMIPSELIFTKDYAEEVHGLKVGKYMAYLEIPWKTVEPNMMNAMELTFSAEYDEYILSTRVYDTFPAYPDDPSDSEAIEEWTFLCREKTQPKTTQMSLIITR